MYWRRISGYIVFLLSTKILSNICVGLVKGVNVKANCLIVVWQSCIKRILCCLYSMCPCGHVRICMLFARFRTQCCVCMWFFTASTPRLYDLVGHVEDKSMNFDTQILYWVWFPNHAFRFSWCLFEMTWRKRRQIHHIKQTEEVVPIMMGESVFRQEVDKSVFSVNTLVFGLGMQFDSVNDSCNWYVLHYRRKLWSKVTE